MSSPEQLADPRSLGKRRRALPLVKGKAVPVKLADLEELDAARADLERARGRVRNVTDRLRRQLGDAEIGTSPLTGRAVLWREQRVTGGGYVRMNHRDDLRRDPP